MGSPQGLAVASRRADLPPPIPGFKRCRTCHQLKPLTDFYLYPKNRDGHLGQCKACTIVVNKRHRDSNPEAQRNQRLWGRYRLTPERYADILAAQGNVCALCRRDAPLFVDHDHGCCPGAKSCGKCVRGLLCQHCNSGLGFFGDDIDAIIRALRYLTASREGA